MKGIMGVLRLQSLSVATWKLLNGWIKWCTQTIFAQGERATSQHCFLFMDSGLNCMHCRVTVEYAAQERTWGGSILPAIHLLAFGLHRVQSHLKTTLHPSSRGKQQWHDHYTLIPNTFIYIVYLCSFPTVWCDKIILKKWFLYNDFGVFCYSNQKKI